MGLLRRIRAILEQSPSERDPRDVVIENGRTARDVVVSAGCRTATVSRGQTGRGYIVRAFLARRGTESETTRAHRLSLIREVCRFLALDDPRTFVPASRFLGIHRRTRVPRVLSLEEGRRFLDACDTLDRQRSSPRRERVLRTLLVLLYLTGLRAGEGLRLTLATALVQPAHASLRALAERRVWPLQQLLDGPVNRFRFRFAFGVRDSCPDCAFFWRRRSVPLFFPWWRF